MALPEVGRQTGDNENTREDIFKEIDILVGMEHENVIFMKEYYEENNKVSDETDQVTALKDALPAAQEHLEIPKTLICVKNTAHRCLQKHPQKYAHA